MKTYSHRAAAFCLVLAAVLGMVSMSCAKTVITIPYLAPDDTRHEYTLSLLRLALEKTVPEYGEYELEHHGVLAVQSRYLRMLQEGVGVNLFWSMTSKEREQGLLPIRIPIQKGLLGHRIFIIKPDMAEAFAQVKTVEDLASFAAGQGHDWPDRKILECNGLCVVASPTYAGCFKMLLENRFDYFPRGVIEPWSEVEQYADEGLVVEETVMLRYPAPIYFFVNRTNPELARRIEKGLRAALADGSFDDLFYNHPYHRQAFEKARIGQRVVIDLENPLLPQETPLHDRALWIDLDKLP